MEVRGDLEQCEAVAHLDVLVRFDALAHLGQQFIGGAVVARCCAVFAHRGTFLVVLVLSPGRGFGVSCRLPG